MKTLKILTEQMERVEKEKKTIMMMGDANLCSKKWNEEYYRYQDMAEEMKGTMAQCGLVLQDIGYTYWIYISDDIEERVTCKILNSSEQSSH